MAEQTYTCDCDVIHEEVVNEVKTKMQSKDDYVQLASLFKLFGDGTRVQILHALEQLKALRLANLVKFRREAQIVYYSLADDHVKGMIEMGFEHLRE